MLDFIPIQYYAALHYNLLLIIVLITMFHTITYSGFTRQTFVFNKVFGGILLLYFVIYMGLRPVSWYFGDMGNYAKEFDFTVYYPDYLKEKGDVLFYYIMKFFAWFKAKQSFFFFIALGYVYLSYTASKRLFGKYHYFGFLMIVSYFEFWSYGTNGIRNGLAASLVLLAFTFMNKKWVMYILFAAAFTVHSSASIPILAYFVTSFYKSERLYFMIWLSSIPLSFLFGDVIEKFITSSGILREDTIQTYFQNKDVYASSFSMIGFRWDFLLYSSLPIAVSYYFIFKKKINDPYYVHLTNIYLLSNTIWVMVINASFSNRFAYLSWFMMAVIMIYPFLKHFVIKSQFKIIGLMILAYYSFSYLMNFVLIYL